MKDGAPFRSRSVVLLDAGGTLIGLDYDRVRATLDVCGPPPDDATLDRAEAQARLWADTAVRAQLQPRELWDGYFTRVLTGAGVDADAAAEALEGLWHAHRTRGLWHRPLAGVYDVLHCLRAAGLRLAVVSNAEGHVERDLEEAGYRALLETVVDSHVVGVAKPAPRIFAIALERLGVSAAEAIYVGDVPAFDVVGARAAGLPAVLLDPHDLHTHVADALRIRDLAELPALFGIDRG